MKKLNLLVCRIVPDKPIPQLNFLLELEGSLYLTMTLKEHINDIRGKLEKGVFPPNESAVSQGIVLRLLNALDWPTFNTQIVHPEYSVEGGRVDFALCHPESTPRVFIEVKQVGNIEGAERQLFQYAFHRGVSIAILTDGREWHFFHPTGQGEYRERKVHEINLTEGNTEESAKRLSKYLHYKSVCTDEAVREIEKDYRNASQQREIEARLPEVWSELVDEKNEDLILVVMDKVKNKTGYEPTEKQVLDFLKSLEKKTEGEVERSRSQLNPSRQSPSILSKTPQSFTRPHSTKSQQTRLRVTMSNGKVIEYHNATDTWLETILTLGPDRVIEVDNNSQIISTSPNFRDGRPEVQHGKYYIAKDYSTKDKKRLLDKISERLGVPLDIEIVDKS